MIDDPSVEFFFGTATTQPYTFGFARSGGLLVSQAVPSIVPPSGVLHVMSYSTYCMSARRQEQMLDLSYCVLYASQGDRYSHGDSEQYAFSFE